MSVDKLHQISYQLEQPNPDWNAIGKITKLGFFSGLRFRIFKNQTDQILNIMKTVNRAFGELEQRGIKVFNKGTLGETEYNRRIEEYRKQFEPYFRICDQVKKLLTNGHKLPKDVRQEYLNLQLNLIGLKYSIGSIYGGLDKVTQPDQTLLDRLIKKVMSWKQNQPLDLEKDYLNPLVVEQLQETAKYQEWCEFILNNDLDNEFDDFANWAIRDYNPVDVFITCRHTQKEIKNALLACILGRIRKPGEEEVLAFKEVATKVDGVRKRVLTLPFYHGPFNKFEASLQKRVNILNPNKEVTFITGNYTLKLKEIWAESSLKNKREARFNFCAWGLINFHPVRGYWDVAKQDYVLPIPNTEDWIHYVPPADIISHSHMEKLYGDNVSGRKIFFKVASTRQKVDFRALNNHGFMKVLLHMGDDKWKVIEPGVYAPRFQQGVVDSVKLFTDTLGRVLSLMDQNGSYTHRQHAALPQFPNEKETQSILDKIRAILFGNGVFQVGGKNCAYPIQRTFEKSITDAPNYFRIHAWQAKTGIGVFDKLFAFLEKMPAFIRRIGMLLFVNVFGSVRSYSLNGKKISLNSYYSKRKDLDFYHPGYLHKQIEDARKTGQGPFVAGELYWGNTAYK